MGSRVDSTHQLPLSSDSSLGTDQANRSSPCWTQASAVHLRKTGPQRFCFKPFCKTGGIWWRCEIPTSSHEWWFDGNMFLKMWITHIYVMLKSPKHSPVSNSHRFTSHPATQKPWQQMTWNIISKGPSKSINCIFWRDPYHFCSVFGT